MRPTAAFIIALGIVLATGCATQKPATAPVSDAERLYRQGKEALDAGYYETAIEHFDTLSARYPFGIYAQQAQLDIAYAYYKSEKPESAIAAADHFIKTYPRHPNVDYAYYLRGLANFGQTRSLLDDLTKSDPARRDPRSARESYQYFAELVERFPDSPYTADALQRMVHLRNYLARHEMYVAGYYMKRGAYVAAVNRAKYVIENYPRTPSIPGALRLMVEAYTRLGLEDLASDARRVLELNYPEKGEG